MVGMMGMVCCCCWRVTRELFADSERFVFQLEIELLVALTVRHHLDHLAPPPVFPLLLPGPLQQGCRLHVLDHLLQGGVARQQLPPPVLVPPQVSRGLPAPANPAVADLTGVERGGLAVLGRPPLHHVLQPHHGLLLPLHHLPQLPLIHPRLLHKWFAVELTGPLGLSCPGLVVRIDITSTTSTTALQAHHLSGKSIGIEID